MVDAETRLRLAAESLNREALGFDADAFTQHLLVKLGIEPRSGGCAGDTAFRADRTPAVGPETGGRRRDGDSASHIEFFNLELEELISNTALHTDPLVLRRIAELMEFLERQEESRGWWVRAADAGDSLAVLTIEEWDTSERTARRQTPGQ